MAGGIAALTPDLPARRGSAEAQVESLRGYIYMLLENLRYILANLDSTNFSEAGLKELGEIFADTVRATTIISNTVITNELYSEYGDIANLTTNRLRTDYMRAERFLAGDTSPLDYISMHDGQIDFITATTDGASAEQLIRDGAAYWWRDGTRTEMTLDATGDPVMCYRYRELTKLTLRFEAVTLADGTETVMPVVVLGAGTGTGDRGKAFIFKDTDGLVIRQVTSSGEYTDIRMGDFVDAKLRRVAACTIDTEAGTLTLKSEGEDAPSLTLEYAAGEDAVRYIWPDGFVSEVSIV